MNSAWLEYRDWIWAGAVLVMTSLAHRGVSAILRRLCHARKWRLLEELASSLGLLVYVVGLNLALDLAPLAPKLHAWLDKGVYLVTVLLMLYIVRRVVMTFLEWTTGKSHHARDLQLGFLPLMQNLVTIFVFVSGAIMILKRFNYDVMSLLTALGVGSLAVGLAAKETLSNMISGFTLIIDRNLRPGDRVNLGGLVGDVREIGLRSTLIQGTDGNMVIVPNSDMVNTKIINFSMPDRRAKVLSLLKFPLAVPFAQADAACREVIAGLPKILADPAPGVGLTALQDGYQLVEASFWVGDLNDAGAAQTAFHERLLKALDVKGIALWVAPVQAVKG